MTDEQENGEATPGILGLHPALRIVLITLFTLALCFVVWRYGYFVCDPNVASPSDLGLPTIFVFSSIALLVLLIPFEKLGIRLKKIGGLEFEQIIETQAAEHVTELAEIEKRLTALEKSIAGVHEGIQRGEAYQEPEIRDLLIKFFSQYRRWAFSPLRLTNWGSQKPGFEKLKDYDPAFLRSMLRKLVAEGVLETSVSKKGNTLYRIAD